MRTPALLGVLLATTAFAANPKVVVDAPGPMKALLTKALKKKFTPVPPRSDVPDDPSASAVKHVVREAGAVGLVTARLEGGVWSVVALNGADGAPLEQFKFKGPAGNKPLKALPKGTDKRLEAALSRARAPGKEKEEVKKEEPKEELTPPPPPATVAEEPKKTTRSLADEKEEEPPVKEVEPRTTASDAADQPIALNVAVGVKLFGRRFYYQDNIFETLATYRLPIGPALQVEADWFPGAHFTKGAGAAIGVSFGFNYAVGISSVATDGARYGTSALRMRIGLIGRIPAGRIQLLPHFGYAIHSFNIAEGAMGEARPNIPNVSYGLLRVGLGTRINLAGPLFATAGFAYQAPLSTGEISSEDYFPRLKAGGLDTNFGLGVSIMKRVELRVGIEYIRYWYTLNPEPGDTSVAGGALDDSFGGSMMLAVTF